MRLCPLSDPQTRGKQQFMHFDWYQQLLSYIHLSFFVSGLRDFLHFWFFLKLCPLADPPQGASGRLCTLFYTNDCFWPTTGGQVCLICSLGILVSELRDFTLSVWCTCPMFESLNNLTCLLKHEYSLTQDCREMSFTSFLSRNPEGILNWMILNCPLFPNRHSLLALTLLGFVGFGGLVPPLCNSGSVA